MRRSSRFQITVSAVIAENAENMHGGLLALSVGGGLQVMHANGLVETAEQLCRVNSHMCIRQCGLTLELEIAGHVAPGVHND